MSWSVLWHPLVFLTHRSVSYVPRRIAMTLTLLEAVLKFPADE